jgi:hypothetical protein
LTALGRYAQQALFEMIGSLAAGPEVRLAPNQGRSQRSRALRVRNLDAGHIDKVNQRQPQPLQLRTRTPAAGDVRFQQLAEPCLKQLQLHRNLPLTYLALVTGVVEYEHAAHALRQRPRASTTCDDRDEIALVLGVAQAALPGREVAVSLGAIADDDPLVMVWPQQGLAGRLGAVVLQLEQGGRHRDGGPRPRQYAAGEAGLVHLGDGVRLSLSFDDRYRRFQGPTDRHAELGHGGRCVSRNGEASNQQLAGLKVREAKAAEHHRDERGEARAKGYPRPGLRQVGNRTTPAVRAGAIEELLRGGLNRHGMKLPTLIPHRLAFSHRGIKGLAAVHATVRHEVVKLLGRGQPAEVRRMSRNAPFGLAGLPLLLLHLGASGAPRLAGSREVAPKSRFQLFVARLESDFLFGGRLQLVARAEDDQLSKRYKRCPRGLWHRDRPRDVHQVSMLAQRTHGPNNQAIDQVTAHDRLPNGRGRRVPWALRSSKRVKIQFIAMERRGGCVLTIQVGPPQR